MELDNAQPNNTKTIIWREIILYPKKLKKPIDLTLKNGPQK